VSEGLFHNNYQNPSRSGRNIGLEQSEAPHIKNLTIAVFDFVELNIDQSSSPAWDRFDSWLANDALHIHRFVHQLRNHKIEAQAPTTTFLAAFYFLESLYSPSRL